MKHSEASRIVVWSIAALVLVVGFGCIGGGDSGRAQHLNADAPALRTLFDAQEAPAEQWLAGYAPYDGERNLVR